MSSKGQIVIPQHMREQLNVGEGSLFAIIETEKGIFLQRINKPSKEELIAELNRISKENQKRVEKLGIRESDVQKIIQRKKKLV